MSKDGMGFKGTVIAGTISALLAAFVIWLLSIFWPAIFEWLVRMALSILKIATYTLSTPAWFIFLIGSLVIWLAIQKVKARREATSNVTQVVTQPSVIELTDSETVIVQLLALSEVRWLYLSEIISQVSLQRLIVERAIDRLLQRDFLIDRHNYLQGTAYCLSSVGRDFAIDHGFVK